VLGEGQGDGQGQRQGLEQGRVAARGAATPGLPLDCGRQVAPVPPLSSCPRETFVAGVPPGGGTLRLENATAEALLVLQLLAAPSSTPREVPLVPLAAEPLLSASLLGIAAS